MRRTYSYSKRSMLDTCLRKYFFEYYASDKRCPVDAERRELIRELKQMSSCAMVAGNIVHRMLALRFGKGASFSREWMIETALRDFDRAVEFARNPSDQSHRLMEKYPPVELLEFSYEDFDGDAEAARWRLKVSSAMETYFDAKPVQELRISLGGTTARAEVPLRGLKLDGWSVGGKIDVLAIGDDKVHVIDWKLGKVERGSDSLQLFTYGWFASKEANVPTDSVTMRRVFLGDALVEEPSVVTAAQARRGKARLMQDIELMEDLHEHGRQGDEEAFTPCDRNGVCRRCPYRAICHQTPLSARSNATSVSLRVLQVV